MTNAGILDALTDTDDRMAYTLQSAFGFIKTRTFYHSAVTYQHSFKRACYYPCLSFKPVSSVFYFLKIESLQTHVYLMAVSDETDEILNFSTDCLKRLKSSKPAFLP